MRLKIGLLIRFALIATCDFVNIGPTGKLRRILSCWIYTPAEGIFVINDRLLIGTRVVIYNN